MKRKIKSILFVATLIILFLWLVFRFIIKPPSFVPYLESIFYWLELVLILEFIWIFKIESRIVMYVSILLIGLGAILDVFGLGAYSEFILRASFASLFVGVIMNFIELARKQELEK